MKLWCFLFFVPGLIAYKHFQEKIPNGSRIPHPCKTNFIWQGLGHMNKDGGGMRNRFGEDFEKNGFVWDECLCKADSDGDGQTNGEELGDPDCEWTPGKQPKITAASKLSHPGICDPHDSEKCKLVNNWQFCDQKEFECGALKAKDVKTFTLKIPKTPVPAVETTYICYMQDIPTDGDYHVIGAIPEIENVNVMHHITISLCTEEAAKSLNGSFDKPALCGMGNQECDGSLYGWTVGINGHCAPEIYGIPIGKKSKYTKAIMQLHWNNPELKEGYFDGSGMKYFYEPKKRQYDAGSGTTGPLVLDIPPYQLNWEEHSVCAPECTKRITGNEKRYITSVLPHMHYLGRGFIMEHWRGDTKLPDLVNTQHYSYDNPLDYEQSPPREFHPGDKIITRCFFNSMTQDKRVFFGESTQAEMCLGFITFYPSDGPGFSCMGYKDHSLFCPEDKNVNSVANQTSNTEGNKCDFEEYFKVDFGQHYIALLKKCDPKGLECLPGCKETIDAMKSHQCYGNDQEYILRFIMAREPQLIPYLHLLNSCNPFKRDVIEAAQPGSKTSLCASPAARATQNLIIVITLLISALCCIHRN